MTYIGHPNSINGGDFTQEIVNRFTVQAISVAPQEIKQYFIDTHPNEYDPYNSVVLFDSETKCIYGYILAHTLEIPHVEIIYEGQRKVVEYLKNGKGLYVSNVVLRNGIKQTPLIQLLNLLHFVYCQGDTNKSGLYIWMDLGEIILSPTEQESGIKINLLNTVSRTFYDKCV